MNKNDTCKNIQNMLVEYLGDELSPGQNDLVSHHLKTCHNCRNEFKKLEMVISGYRKIHDFAPSRTLYHNLKSVVINQKKPWYFKLLDDISEFMSQPAPVSTAASLCLVIIMFYFLSFSSNNFIPSIDNQTCSVLDDSIAVNIIQFIEDNSDTLLNSGKTPDNNESFRMINNSNSIKKNIIITPLINQVSTKSEFGNILNKRVFKKYKNSPETRSLSPSSFIQDKYLKIRDDLYQKYIKFSSITS